MTIEQIRNFEPLRGYNWLLHIDGAPGLLICSGASFSLVNHDPRIVDQGNLSFNIPAIKSLSLLDIEVAEDNDASVINWIYHWHLQCISRSGLVTPVGRVARNAKLTEHNIQKQNLVTYIMTIVPVGSLNINKSVDEEYVIRNINFAILGIEKQ